MDNSVNNNVNNSVNNLGTTAGVGATAQQTVNNNGGVTPSVNVSTTNVATPGVSNTSVINPNVTATTQTVNTTNKNNSNTYLLVGFFVGFVLLAAIFLLVLLLTGVIGNRNRLTCTKTISEDGYTHVSTRYYKFDKNIYNQVNNVDTFTYTSTLTDDIYNQKFGPIAEITSGITEFGFGTQVFREGNVVTITSYSPNFFGETLDDVKKDTAENGFTCE